MLAFRDSELQTLALSLFGFPFPLWLGILLFLNLLSLGFLTFLSLTLRLLPPRTLLGFSVVCIPSLRCGLLRLSFLQNGPKHEEDGMRFGFSL